MKNSRLVVSQNIVNLRVKGLKYVTVGEFFYYLATGGPGQQNDTVTDDKHAVISKNDCLPITLHGRT